MTRSLRLRVGKARFGASGQPRVNLLALVACTCLLLSACSRSARTDPGSAMASEANLGSGSIGAQVIYRGVQCDRRESGVELISDRGHWNKWQRRQQRTLWNPEASEVSQPEFSKATVIVVSMGQKPTTGYALELAGDVVREASGELRIPILLIVPPPGSATGQMLTSPCVAIQLQDTGFTDAELESLDTVLLRR